MSEQSIGIIVLGPHRSGTSLVASLLGKLGCHLGGELVPATAHNERGHWEHRGIVEAHDRFLRRIGRTWSDTSPIPDETFHSEAAADAKGTIREILESDFRSRERWVLKDPRLCRLLPLWLPLSTLPVFGIKFLHLVRSPLAVARSLKARDDFGTQKSFLLWLRHTVEPEAHTRDCDRIWISLEALVTDPTSEIKRMARWAGIELEDDSVGDPISSTLDPRLIHYRPDEKVTFELLDKYPWLSASYKAVCQLTSGELAASHKALDRVRLQIGKTDGLIYGDTLAALREEKNELLVRLTDEILQFQRQLDAQRAEIGVQHKALDAQRAEIGVQHKALDALHILLSDVPNTVEELKNRLATFREVGDRLENKHLDLLSRSLGAISDIETHFIEREKQLSSESQKASDALERLKAETVEQVRSLEHQLSAGQVNIQSLEHEMSTVRAHSQSLEREVATLHDRIASLSTTLESQIQQFESVIGSRSWRITKPLRGLRAHFRGLKHRPAK